MRGVFDHRTAIPWRSALELMIPCMGFRELGEWGENRQGARSRVLESQGTREQKNQFSEQEAEKNV